MRTVPTTLAEFTDVITEHTYIGKPVSEVHLNDRILISIKLEANMGTVTITYKKEGG